MELELKKQKLKVQALLETNQKVTSEAADYRAEITMLVEEIERLTEENKALKEAQDAATLEVPADAPTDTE